MDRAERPLAGRVVLSTRPEGRGGGLARRLGQLGATVDTRPTISLEPPSDPRPARAAVGRIGVYDWIVFSSAHGVRFFCEACRAARVSADDIDARIAAVGPGTAVELERAGLHVDVVAGDSRAEGLAAALSGRVGRGQRVLVVRPEVARPVLLDALRELGADPQAVAFYRNVAASNVEQIATDVRAGRYDVVLLTSPSTLGRLLGAGAGQAEQLRRALAASRPVAIGAVTAEALRVAGVEPAAVAARPTEEAIVAAIVALFD